MYLTYKLKMPPSNPVDAESFITSNIKEETIQKRYLDALKASDTSSSTPAATPSEIEERYKISIDDQVNYGISITKKQIRDYLKTQGRILRNGTVKIIFKGAKYKECFDKEVSRKGNGTHLSALVFTYAEVRYMDERYGH